ncbi:MAG: GspH/FimT family pseudopilin [Hypericibacter sp.]
MSTSRTGRRIGNQGYTLLELMIVLLIIGLCITAAVHAGIQRMPGFQLRTGTGVVAAALREARSLAIRDNQDTAVVLDIEARTLLVGADGRERQLDSSLGISLYTATSEMRGQDRGAIRFFPDGSSTGGRIRLSSETQVNDVVVSWLTGYVEIHEDVH